MKHRVLYLVIFCILGVKCSQVVREDPPPDRRFDDPIGDVDDLVDEFTKEDFFNIRCKPENEGTDTVSDMVLGTVGLNQYNPFYIARQCLKKQLNQVYNKTCPRVERLQERMNNAQSESERQRVQAELFRLQQMHNRVLGNYYKAANRAQRMADRSEKKMENTDNFGKGLLNFLIYDEASGASAILEVDSYSDCFSFLNQTSNFQQPF